MQNISRYEIYLTIGLIFSIAYNIYNTNIILATEDRLYKSLPTIEEVAKALPNQIIEKRVEVIPYKYTVASIEGVITSSRNLGHNKKEFSFKLNNSVDGLPETLSCIGYTCVDNLNNYHASVKITKDGDCKLVGLGEKN